MLEALKEQVYQANLDLVKHHLVIFTWGNVSALDETGQYLVIKPSGVEYDKMTSEDMVVTDLDGNVIEGHLKPSSDLMTHCEIYKNFQGVRGVVHTHSKNATAFAQANQDILALGTTHGDYFYGTIPCTRKMSTEEIQGKYEKETGKVIVETFQTRQYNPLQIPACLVASHGPFVWGKDANEAVYNSVVLEQLADMAIRTFSLQETKQAMQQELLDKHYLRKHGEKAYYGQ